VPELDLSKLTDATPPAVELPLNERDLPVRAHRREAVGRWALIAADGTAVTCAMLIVAALGGAHFTIWAVALLPFYYLLAKTAGLYDRDQFVLRKTTLDEAPVLFGVAAIFALAIEGVQALEFTGRSQPLLLGGTLTCMLIGARAIARFVVVRSMPTERVLIIGDLPTTVFVKDKLAEDPTLNGRVVGYVALHAKGDERADDLMGTVNDLPDLIRDHSVDRAIVAPTHGGGEDVIDVVRLATACGVRVSVLPRLLEAIGTSVEFDDLAGHPLLGVRGVRLSPSSRFLKRALDLTVATVALLVLWPLLVVLAIAVKLSSPGPVLFRQWRIGRHETTFRMLKFRSMVRDADARKHELLERNEAEPLFKIADDPRITRVGRLMRRRSLDELPQLFNVLRGDMSVVGPRPFIAEEDQMFSGWQRRRHTMAPGMTGPWQILGSSRVPISDMVLLDYLYCANWSLWADVKIIIRTIPYIFSRRSGEYPSSRPSEAYRLFQR
jgi:exopolysaccharide biosynthesis polyprenyl glycosylphosphotransferase